MQQIDSPIANLTKFQSISFGVAIEAFIDEPALLYKLEDGQELSLRDDKRVVFYVDKNNPRHFRPYFIGAQAALSFTIAFIEYMLFIGKFIVKDDIGQLLDMTNVAGILYFCPEFADRRRIYLDQESFEHLFGGHLACKHKATDADGRAQIIDYNDDGIVGTASAVRISKRRQSSMSATDFYITERFKALPQNCIAVHEGRGWLWIIAAFC